MKTIALKILLTWTVLIICALISIQEVIFNSDFNNYGAKPSSFNLITGAPTGTLGVNILSSVTISLPVNIVNFSNMYPNDVDDTTDNNPPPFKVRNDGSVYVDITIEATNLFNGTGAQNPSQYYQFKIQSNNDGPGSVSAWTNISIAGVPIPAIDALNFQNGNDTAQIEIKLQIPPDEPAGSKTSVITFTASQDT